MAEPESSVVCFTRTDPGLDLFVLVDELTARGWHTQPQLSYAGLPASVHLTVTAAVAPRVAEFGPDLADAVAAARAAGPVVLPPDLLALAGDLTAAGSAAAAAARRSRSSSARSSSAASSATPPTACPSAASAPASSSIPRASP
jgi:hypothetical protein